MMDETPKNIPAEGETKEVEKRDMPATKPMGSSAGVIILQWLTYAFWGWTILALAWLVAIVLENATFGLDVTETLPFAIAASLVLLPLSIVCDLFYGRREPQHKVGGAMVVMVIHAVLFALFGIGTLISAVLIIVQIAIGSGGSANSQMPWLWTSLICALIYGLAFLRTLNPSPRLHLAKVFPAVMAIVVGLFIVLGFVGPVAQANLTRDDRDIVASMDDIKQAVNNSISANKKIPASLHDLSMPATARSVVERGLVTLRADAQGLALSPDASGRGAGTGYRYQLCTTYKQADKSEGSSYSANDSEGEYQTTLSTYGHPAGNVCYKLQYTIYR